jgi:Cdc6-like AAA superfamily ATPase
VLLAVARFFRSSTAPHASTGEVERIYHVVCEERGETPRGHTQFWKYLNQLKGLDAVRVKLDASSQGRTQLISLAKVTAGDLEKEVLHSLEQK